MQPKMGDLIKKIRHENGVVEIYSDNSAPNPRDAVYQNVGRMVFLHKNLKLGDEHFFKTPDEFADFCDEHPGILLLPIYISPNNGIELSVSKTEESGHLGYMYATPEMIATIPNIDSCPMEDRNELVLDEFASELEAYNEYLLGNSYGYIAKDNKGNFISEGWGYIGDDFDTNGLYYDAGIPD